MRVSQTLAAFICAIVAVSCSHPQPRALQAAADSIELTPLSQDGGAPDPSHRQLIAGSVIAHLVAVVPDRTIGPFVAHRGDLAMAAYIDAGDSGQRRIVSIPMRSDGATRGGPKVVTPTTNEPTMLVLRTTGGASPSFVAAWTALTDRGEALSIVPIADDGTARGGPTELARTNDDIVWVDVIATPHGAVCVWAEETRAGDANVLAAAIDPDGELHGSPSRVIRGVTAWQVVATQNGVGLATVNSMGGGSSVSRTGTLVWTRLGEDARPLGLPVVVNPRPTASGDIDVVRSGPNWVFAWTDHSTSDPFVATASIDDTGKVHGPERAIDAKEGGSSLVDLAAGPTGTILAWEEPARKNARARHLHLSHLDANAVVDARSPTILMQGEGAAELVATETGYALLASMRACEASHPNACATNEPIATFARFNRKLEVVQTEPLHIGDAKDPVTIAWGLSCKGDRCGALTVANSVLPAKIASVDLVPRHTEYIVPTLPALPADAPRLGTVTTVAGGADISDFALANVGDATLIATMTSAIDEGEAAAAARAERRGATISVHPVDARMPTFQLTNHALTAGGIGMAAGATPDDGAAVVWVSRELGDPQVHVSRVDKTGKRTNDVKITSAKGDASDVAVAWSNGGWIVAWVDARDGNGEVYATKVDRGLNRIAREERITNAPGDASDVAILAKDDSVWLAWSDPRENVRDSFGDIYLARLRSKDAKRDGDDVRVLATAAHSRSPSLVASGDGALVGWIEEAPSGADVATSQSYGALFLGFDAHLKPRGEPVHARAAGGAFPSAISMDASHKNAGSSVHVILSRTTDDELWIDSLELGGSNATHAYPLIQFDGPSSLDVTMHLFDGAAYFIDDGATMADKRVRRAAIEWKH